MPTTRDADAVRRQGSQLEGDVRTPIDTGRGEKDYARLEDIPGHGFFQVAVDGDANTITLTPRVGTAASEDLPNGVKDSVWSAENQTLTISYLDPDASDVVIDLSGLGGGGGEAPTAANVAAVLAGAIAAGTDLSSAPTAGTIAVRQADGTLGELTIARVLSAAVPTEAQVADAVGDGETLTSVPDDALVVLKDADSNNLQVVSFADLRTLVAGTLAELKTLIAGATAFTGTDPIANEDSFVVVDASGTPLRRVTYQQLYNSIRAGLSSGDGQTANVQAALAAATAITATQDEDQLFVLDASDSNTLKRVPISALPGEENEAAAVRYTRFPLRTGGSDVRQPVVNAPHTFRILFATEGVDDAELGLVQDGSNAIFHLRKLSPDRRTPIQLAGGLRFRLEPRDQQTSRGQMVFQSFLREIIPGTNTIDESEAATHDLGIRTQPGGAGNVDVDVVFDQLATALIGATQANTGGSRIYALEVVASPVGLGALVVIPYSANEDNALLSLARIGALPSSGGSDTAAQIRDKLAGLPAAQRLNSAALRNLITDVDMTPVPSRPDAVRLAKTRIGNGGTSSVTNDPNAAVAAPAAAGTAGQVLKTGEGGVPVWENESGGSGGSSVVDALPGDSPKGTVLTLRRDVGNMAAGDYLREDNPQETMRSSTQITIEQNPLESAQRGAEPEKEANDFGVVDDTSLISGVVFNSSSGGFLGAYIREDVAAAEANDNTFRLHLQEDGGTLITIPLRRTTTNSAYELNGQTHRYFLNRNALNQLNQGLLAMLTAGDRVRISLDRGNAANPVSWRIRPDLVWLRLGGRAHTYDSVQQAINAGVLARDGTLVSVELPNDTQETQDAGVDFYVVRSGSPEIPAQAAADGATSRRNRAAFLLRRGVGNAANDFTYIHPYTTSPGGVSVGGLGSVFPGGYVARDFALPTLSEIVESPPTILSWDLRSAPKEQGENSAEIRVLASAHSAATLTLTTPNELDENGDDLGPQTYTLNFELSENVNLPGSSVQHQYRHYTYNDPEKVWRLPAHGATAALNDFESVGDLFSAPGTPLNIHAANHLLTEGSGFQQAHGIIPARSRRLVRLIAADQEGLPAAPPSIPLPRQLPPFGDVIDSATFPLLIPTSSQAAASLGDLQTGRFVMVVFAQSSEDVANLDPRIIQVPGLGEHYDVGGILGRVGDAYTFARAAAAGSPVTVRGKGNAVAYTIRAVRYMQ